MRLTAYEKDVRREIDKWQRGDASMITQALSFVMKPVDWVVEQAVPEELVEQAGEAVEEFLAVLDQPKVDCEEQRDVGGDEEDAA